MNFFCAKYKCQKCYPFLFYHDRSYQERIIFANKLLSIPLISIMKKSINGVNAAEWIIYRLQNKQKFITLFLPGIFSYPQAGIADKSLTNEKNNARCDVKIITFTGNRAPSEKVQQGNE
ncbi:hypothetical protein ACFSFZ_14585 [Mixta tenebrionis]|uniref:Uncharacterized protein n=1 Tax=Mixta tenebrionis TaxID=2562439 RepID=A0A506VB85_9GAMM|nr:MULTISPECIES: hypothetical protein [Mixta]TPW43231.1 hypothetical protein FKM52_06625 [Mixta tenebrionis]